MENGTTNWTEVIIKNLLLQLNITLTVTFQFLNFIGFSAYVQSRDRLIIGANIPQKKVGNGYFLC